MKRKALPLILIGMMLCLCAAPVVYYAGRPLPVETREELYPGVIYYRSVRISPRPLIVHAVTVDLTTPGLAFLVTPGDPASSEPLRAMTTSQFMEKYKLQVAVNGDGFTPWHSYSIFDYYPHIGDPVTPNGFASSGGVIYHADPGGRPVLSISVDNHASIGAPVEPAWNAISGDEFLVENSQPLPGLDDSLAAPRTAIGLDLNTDTLIIVVADGRQPLYSQGITMVELADILISYGADIAMSLDGGGSSTLAVEGPLGPRLLNSPIDNHIPGRERAVGNHLGIYITNK